MSAPAPARVRAGERWARERLPRIRSVAALLLSLVALAFAMWIVVPAPTRFLLTLGVGAPEVSAWLAVHSLFAILAALPDVRARRAARWASGIAVVALALALSPFLRFGAVARSAERQMVETFGTGYDSAVAALTARRPRSAPLVASDLFRGFTPGSARLDRDVPVAMVSGEQLTMDVYRPITRGPHPVIVQVYGGAWQRGAPSDFAEFARYFAARGFVVFAVDYRHAPQHRFPAQVDDVRTALRWIAEHAAGYDADTSRVVLVGRSAGAHLAMLAAWMPGDVGVRVRGIVNYYGPVDLVEGYRHPPSPDPLDVRAVEQAFVGGTPDTEPARYRAASPITYAARALPPVLLVYGARDHIVEPHFGRSLHETLRANGTPSLLVEIPWAEHAFDAVPHGPSGQLARYVTERFVAWALLPGH